MDHVIVLNERHLKRLMADYVRYYHEDRTHLGLAKGTRPQVGKSPIVRRRTRSAAFRDSVVCTIVMWLRLKHSNKELFADRS